MRCRKVARYRCRKFAPPQWATKYASRRAQARSVLSETSPVAVNPARLRNTGFRRRFHLGGLGLGRARSGAIGAGKKMGRREVRLGVWQKRRGPRWRLAWLSFNGNPHGVLAMSLLPSRAAGGHPRGPTPHIAKTRFEPTPWARWARLNLSKCYPLAGGART